MSNIVFYSDLNCPNCFVVEERIAALGLEDRVEWRGVEHAPELPVPVEIFIGEPGDSLARELREVMASAPDVPLRRQLGKPTSRPALNLVAAAVTRDRGAADALRVELQRRLWRDGEDISDPELLARAAERHGLAEAVNDPAGPLVTADWQREWIELGFTAVPLLLDVERRSFLLGLSRPDEISALVG